MKIFSKIDKRILLALLIILIVVLAIGFFLAKSILAPVVKVENKMGGATTENQVQNNNEGKTPNEEKKLVPEETFSICLDKCGDGFCQISDPDCGKGEQNCICLENKSECPQDCK